MMFSQNVRDPTVAHSQAPRLEPEQELESLSGTAVVVAEFVSCPGVKLVVSPRTL